MKSFRRRLLHVAFALLALLALLGGAVHVPSVQRALLHWGSDLASESTGLSVRMGSVRLLWWKGRIELTDLAVTRPGGEVLVAATSLSARAIFKAGNTWHVHGLDWQGGEADIAGLVDWAAARSASDGAPGPLLHFEGIHVEGVRTEVPSEWAGGGAAIASLDDGAFRTTEGGWRASFGEFVVDWDAQRTADELRPAGRLTLKKARAEQTPHRFQVAMGEARGMGWTLSAQVAWPSGEPTGLPEGELTWAYAPAEGATWWSDLGWDWGQTWWAFHPSFGALHSSPEALTIAQASLPGGLKVDGPLRLEWPDGLGVPSGSGPLTLDLAEAQRWWSDDRHSALPEIPWEAFEEWLGTRPQVALEWEGLSAGNLTIRTGGGEERARVSVARAGQSIDLHVQGLDGRDWGLGGLADAEITAHLETLSPLDEAGDWEMKVHLEHRDPAWPLRGVDVAGRWDRARNAFAGSLESSDPSAPVSLEFHASTSDEGWEVQWEGAIAGARPAGSWALHSGWSGRIRRNSDEPFRGSTSFRNIVLLDEGRPTTFERLDIMGNWDGREAQVRWESDLGTGQVNAATDESAWRNWLHALEKREPAASTPPFAAEIMVRRFAPIALLTGHPIRVADGSRITASTRADGFAVAVESEEVAYSGWVARGIALQADGWDRDFYANLSVNELAESGETWARDWALDIHGDSLWAMDVQWLGWGDAPTQLRLQIAPKEEAWDALVYEASVPWVEGRMELSEVPAQVTYTPGIEAAWSIEGFKWAAPGARLEIDGTVGARADDGLFVLATLNALPKWKGLDGWPIELDSASISLEACRLLDTPTWSSRAEIRRVTWGDAVVERVALQADGDLTDAAVTWEAGPLGAPYLRGSGRLPLASDASIDMRVVSEGLPLEWVNPLMPAGTVTLQGGLDGWARWSGSFGKPVIEGTLAAKGVEAAIGYLGIAVTVDGVANVYPDRIAFDGWTVRDDQGSPATLTGTVFHRDFADWNFDLSLDASREPLHLMDLTRNDNDLFYGSAFVRGDANVSGYANNLVVEARLKTEPGTRFALPLDAATDARYADFISFRQPESVEAEVVERDLSRIRLDLALDIDEQAEARIIFDESVGDEITGKTRGALNLSIDDFERFNMTGQLEVVEGSYLFTLQNVINKRFTVEPGGTVTWFGDPYAAEIDLNALYEVRTALDPLLPLEDNLPGRSKVMLSMGLKGNLMRPEIGFGIAVPEVDTRLQALVESALINEEELNRQVMGLLVLQQFMSPDPTSAIGSTGLQERSTEFLASQIGFWLSQMTQDVNVGLDYGTDAVSGEQALAVALSAQLLDDRLHVEGAVGTNHLFGGSSEDLQVQDIRIRYDLPPDGTFQVTGYTTTNPAITGQAGSVTQGVGVLMQSEFNSIAELWKRMRRGKRRND